MLRRRFLFLFGAVPLLGLLPSRKRPTSKRPHNSFIRGEWVGGKLVADCDWPDDFVMRDHAKVTARIEPDGNVIIFQADLHSENFST